jgi:hypothetical protein
MLRIETERRYAELQIGSGGRRREWDIQHNGITLCGWTHQHGGRATDHEQQEQEREDLLDASVALR